MKTHVSPDESAVIEQALAFFDTMRALEQKAIEAYFGGLEAPVSLAEVSALHLDYRAFEDDLKPILEDVPHSYEVKHLPLLLWIKMSDLHKAVARFHESPKAVIEYLREDAFFKTE